MKRQRWGLNQLLHLLSVLSQRALPTDSAEAVEILSASSSQSTHHSCRGAQASDSHPRTGLTTQPVGVGGRHVSMTPFYITSLTFRLLLLPRHLPEILSFCHSDSQQTIYTHNQYQKPPGDVTLSETRGQTAQVSNSAGGVGSMVCISRVEQKLHCKNGAYFSKRRPIRPTPHDQEESFWKA